MNENNTIEHTSAVAPQAPHIIRGAGHNGGEAMMDWLLALVIGGLAGLGGIAVLGLVVLYGESKKEAEDESMD